MVHRATGGVSGFFGAPGGCGARRVRVIAVIRSSVAWAWAALSLPALTLVSLLGLPFVGQRGHDWASTFWMRSVLWLTGLRVRVTGTEHVRRDDRYVVACNHQSLIDILAVVSVLQPLTPVRFMAKRSLFFVPVLGFAMWAFGHVPVDRARGRGIVGKIRRAEKAAAAASFVFFPEGTRSLDGAMRPFKRGAFWLAARTNVPVLPITITGALEAFPKGQCCVYGNPEVQLAIHAPIPVKGPRDSAHTVEELETRTWHAIAEGLPAELRTRSHAA